jgi:hypothetical protein
VGIISNELRRRTKFILERIVDTSLIKFCCSSQSHFLPRRYPRIDPRHLLLVLKLNVIGCSMAWEHFLSKFGCDDESSNNRLAKKPRKNRIFVSWNPTKLPRELVTKTSLPLLLRRVGGSLRTKSTSCEGPQHQSSISSAWSNCNTVILLVNKQAFEN